MPLAEVGRPRCRNLGSAALARITYLLRISGRYVFNIRFAPFRESADPKAYIRFALRTASYRTAVRRVALVLPVVLDLRVCEDFQEYSRRILRQLDDALQIDGPYTEDQFVYWCAIETATRTFLTEARGRGHDVIGDLPDFPETWRSFVERQVRLDRAFRKLEDVGSKMPATLHGTADLASQQKVPPFSGELVPFKASALRRRPRLDRPATLVPFEGVEHTSSDIQEQVSDPSVRQVQATTAVALLQSRQEQPAGSPNRVLLSEARRQLLASDEIAKGDQRGLEDYGRVLDFTLALLGDRPLSDFTQEEWFKLETAITQIPHPYGLDLKKAGKGKRRSEPATVFERYLYGQRNPARVKKYINKTTVKGTYHRCLNGLFAFAKKKGILKEVPYEFTLVAAYNPAPTERDAFKDEEVLRLFSIPLFQGSRSESQYWTPGKVLVQNEVYWGFIMIFITGMRHSEIGGLRNSDLVEENGRWHINLKPLKGGSPSDKGGGRKLKTTSSARKVPLPAVLIQLGLIERRNALVALGEARLFPDWPIYINKQSGPTDDRTASFEEVAGRQQEVLAET